MIGLLIFYFSTGVLLALSCYLHSTFSEDKRFLALTVLVIFWPIIVLVSPQLFFRDREVHSVERDSLQLAMSSLNEYEVLSLSDAERLHLDRVLEIGEAGVTYFCGSGAQVLQEFWDSDIPPAVYSALRSAQAALRESEPDNGVLFSLQRPDWYIGFSNEFLKCVSRIDRKVQGRILEAIGKIADAPTDPIGDTIKPLTGNLSGLWRMRIGNDRLVYFPHIQTRRVTLISFGPRGSVYSTLPKTENLTSS